MDAEAFERVARAQGQTRLLKPRADRICRPTFGARGSVGSA